MTTTTTLTTQIPPTTTTSLMLEPSTWVFILFFILMVLTVYHYFKVLLSFVSQLPINFPLLTRFDLGLRKSKYVLEPYLIEDGTNKHYNHWVIRERGKHGKRVSLHSTYEEATAYLLLIEAAQQL